MTKALERFLYAGSGSSYLGWAFPEHEVQDDGSWKLIKNGGCRVWKFDKEVPPAWWKVNASSQKHVIEYIKPLWWHLKGCFRGIVVDDRTTHVPFLAVDLDRHTGTPTAEFLRFVEDVAVLFETACPDCRISAELNPKNGSTKLFAWRNDCTPFEIQAARERSAVIHARIVEATGRNVEVFVKSAKNLRLPLHPEKHTIIDSGHLGRATRVRGTERQKFETHSVVEFVQWLVSGKNYDRDALMLTVADSCKNLPDEPVACEPRNTVVPKNQQTFDLHVGNFEVESSIESSPASCGQSPRSAGRSERSGRGLAFGERSASSIEELRGEANSFERQQNALLIACRKARRVLTLKEALDFIREHELFTGSWEENEGRRACRISAILKHIAKTFDPTKCGSGNAFEIDVNKYMNWSRKQFASPVRRKVEHGRVKETGEVTTYGRYTAFTAEEAAWWLAINEYCRKTSLHGDGGVPEERVAEIWKLLKTDGQISRPWNVRRWRLIRDVLVSLGAITCDYKSEDQKAYCYGEGRWYPGRTVVWGWTSKTGMKGSYRDTDSQKKEKKRRRKGLNSEGVYDTLRMLLAPIDFIPRGPPTGEIAEISKL